MPASSRSATTAKWLDLADENVAEGPSVDGETNGVS